MTRSIPGPHSLEWCRMTADVCHILSGIKTRRMSHAIQVNRIKHRIRRHTAQGVDLTADIEDLRHHRAEHSRWNRAEWRLRMQVQQAGK